MAFAYNGAVRLWFESLGQTGDPAVLLLNGAGKQATDSPNAFCDMLVERGFRVIRFDQRDTGLSTGFAEAGADAAGVAVAVANGRTPKLAYTSDDMAADALAILDAAGVERAHLVGRSLGSFIAQRFALDHPDRVQSLTLIMAFSRSIGNATPPDRLAQLDTEHFSVAEEFVERQIATARALGNPDYFDEMRIRAEAALAFDRGNYRGAIARHFSVGMAAPDLRPRLSDLVLPTQVIHGRLDKVIRLTLAEETASAIRDARLEILDDMAHEGPPQLWDRWVHLFTDNAARSI